jgi:hypothetical protein
MVTTHHLPMIHQLLYAEPLSVRSPISGAKSGKRCAGIAGLTTVGMCVSLDRPRVISLLVMLSKRKRSRGFAGPVSLTMFLERVSEAGPVQDLVTCKLSMSCSDLGYL